MAVRNQIRSGIATLILELTFLAPIAKANAVTYTWNVYKKIQAPQEIVSLTDAKYEFTQSGFSCEVTPLLKFGEKSPDNKWQMRTLLCTKGDWKVETSASCGG